MKTLLYVGAGHDLNNPEPTVFVGYDKIIRLDSDPTTKPTVVGDMVDLAKVVWPTGVFDRFDGIASVHSIEHVPYWLTLPTLTSWRDHLRFGGTLFVRCPSLECAAEVLLEQGYAAEVYRSPVGPITPIDMLYGYPGFVQTSPAQAHRTGFTAARLDDLLGRLGMGRHPLTPEGARFAWRTGIAGADLVALAVR